MAFWKKSEDPWDIDPGKKPRCQVTAFESEQDADSIAAASKERQPFWRRKTEEEQPEEAPICPWCHQKMTRGYLLGGRDGLRLSDQKPTALFGSLGHDTIEFSDEGFLVTHKSCWQCKDCRKLVADLPVPVPYDSFARWDGNPAAPFDPEKQEKEK